jgi:hypothetical protein
MAWILRRARSQVGAPAMPKEIITRTNIQEIVNETDKVMRASSHIVKVLL